MTSVKRAKGERERNDGKTLYYRFAAPVSRQACKQSGTKPGNDVLATEPWNAFANTKIQIDGEESERGRKSMLANDSLGRYQSLETAFKPDTRGGELRDRVCRIDKVQESWFHS